MKTASSFRVVTVTDASFGTIVATLNHGRITATLAADREDENE